MERIYNYKMGYAIDDVAIPDPTSFSGAESDLDTLGKRDSTGELRRNMVAHKYHTKLGWDNIEWDMIQYICAQMHEKPRFTFSYPDASAGSQKIIAYCGDREWEAVKCVDPSSDKWIGTLKVSIIQI